MHPESPPPAAAVLIRRAREAIGLTAEAAAAQVRASGGKITAPYWRNIENGYGYRRGETVPMPGSDEKLAFMAAVTGVTPAQLTEAGRPGAAAVLRAMGAHRLTGLLIARRDGDGLPDRDAFCADRGISPALARDVENGHRTALSGTETAAVSRAYRVTQASVTDVLAGDAISLEPLAGDDDEATVWAEVNRHPYGTPGAVIFPSGVPDVITEEARRWDVLSAAKVPVEELVPMIAWWRRRNRQDADPGHNGPDRLEVPRAS
jgi:hypothetical protein